MKLSDQNHKCMGEDNLEWFRSDTVITAWTGFIYLSKDLERNCPSVEQDKEESGMAHWWIFFQNQSFLK